MLAPFRYRFRVRMTNAEGNGPWSRASATFRTQAVPPAPPRLLPVAVDNVGHDWVTLEWDPPSQPAGDPPVTSYQVQYRLNDEAWLLVCANMQRAVECGGAGLWVLTACGVPRPRLMCPR